METRTSEIKQQLNKNRSRIKELNKIVSELQQVNKSLSDELLYLTLKRNGLHCEAERKRNQSQKAAKHEWKQL